jgi:hypothetical protein
MDLAAITVVSLMIMFCGRIAAEEKNRFGLDLGSDSDLDLSQGLSNRFMGYGSDYCCMRIDSQTAVLKSISSATKKLTKDVGAIKTGVACKGDNSSELKRPAVDVEKLSSELKSELKRQAVDVEKLSSELKSELKRQAGDLEKLSTELKSELKKQAGDLEKLSTELKSELTKQAVDQEQLSSELKSELTRQAEDLKGVNTTVNEISVSLNKHAEDLRVHDKRMQEQGLLLQNMSNLITELHGSLTRPKDCSDIRAMGNSTSGVYRVYPGSHVKRYQADVYCDMTTPGGNWLVFQRRKDGSVAFERTWNEYLNGFGNPGGEFWLGNEALYLLTSNGNYKLRIDMEDFEGNKRYAEYSTFSITSSADKYRLTATGYTGNAEWMHSISKLLITGTT